MIGILVEFLLECRLTLVECQGIDGPGATLAAAQFAAAREYGFASWRRLAAYVTALRDKGNQLRQAAHDGELDVATAILDDYIEEPQTGDRLVTDGTRFGFPAYQGLIGARASLSARVSVIITSQRFST